MYELGFTSKQDKSKEFRKYCFNKLFPQIRDNFEQLAIDKKDEEHQVAIDEKDSAIALAIDEKDSAIALINDDLDESQSNIAVLEHDNLELQRQNEILRRRYVPYLEDRSKNNSMIFIRKNNSAIFENVAILGQQQYVTKTMQHKLADFPNGEIILLVETSNAIAH